MAGLFKRVLRHGWLDQADARRLVGPAEAARLRAQVAASERLHTGQIRICIEGGLPLSYLWRHWRQHLTRAELVRQRAVMMFAKLRVWDTEHNNGVLIYLLLAERAIELVADRGLARVVGLDTWQVMTGRLEQCLRNGRAEQGLHDAIADVSALLEQHFPRRPADATPAVNELPDEPVFR